MFEIGQLTRLPLGYVGESNTRRIEIDMSAWLEDFPGATIVAEVVRPDLTKYIAATDMENGILTWLVNPGEVRIAGKGFAQIAAIDLDTGDQYRSRVVQTIVSNSLDEFTTEVLDDIDPANAWVNRVLKAAELAAESRDAAAESAELAKQAAAESGYMQFEIGDDGRLYYYRTDNVDIMFEIEEGRLMVYEQA